MIFKPKAMHDRHCADAAFWYWQRETHAYWLLEEDEGLVFGEGWWVRCQK